MNRNARSHQVRLCSPPGADLTVYSFGSCAHDVLGRQCLGPAAGLLSGNGTGPHDSTPRPVQTAGGSALTGATSLCAGDSIAAAVTASSLFVWGACIGPLGMGQPCYAGADSAVATAVAGVNGADVTSLTCSQNAAFFLMGAWCVWLCGCVAVWLCVWLCVWLWLWPWLCLMCMCMCLDSCLTTDVPHAGGNAYGITDGTLRQLSTSGNLVSLATLDHVLETHMAIANGKMVVRSRSCVGLTTAW